MSQRACAHTHIHTHKKHCTDELPLKFLRRDFFFFFLKITLVRTRFVSNHNSVGFARKKAQTISFVERGFERLGLGHQAVSLSWCSYMVKSFSL